LDNHFSAKVKTTKTDGGASLTTTGGYFTIITVVNAGGWKGCKSNAGCSNDCRERQRRAFFW
jgi:hypothetical protein